MLQFRFMNNAEVYSFPRVIINYPMQLSLLIPTECRRDQLSRLIEGLEFQVQYARRSSEVEILSYPDAGEHSIGYKRNILYHSRRWWGYQWLLDGTEGLRHRLGLRMVNRLRLRDSRISRPEAAPLGRGHGQHARD
jgi:hypothetical protein